MASVAQKIVAGPLAAVGSIGAVVTCPNFARRMETEGVGAVQKTAGKYKRTVTPWKEPGEEELAKLQEDVDVVQKHFVAHIEKYRGDRIPNLEEVATGEVWYGEDAKEKGLVDQIGTSEDYLADKMEAGCEVMQVEEIQKKKVPSWRSMLRSTVAGSDPIDAAVGSLGRPTPMLEYLGATMDQSIDDIDAMENIMTGMKHLSTEERHGLLKVLLRMER